MKVLLVNTTDISGGAARAAYRLHQGLQQAGVESQMLVQSKLSGDATVQGPRTRLAESIGSARISADALPLKLYRHREATTFSLQWLPDNIDRQVNQLNPDIVNLHWIGEAFMQVESIAKIKHSIVWTLHDMWSFTGGCHYSEGCDRYMNSCGNCPQLHSGQEWDLSRWIWQRKVKAFKSINLTVVALSEWLAQEARSSSLFKQTRIEVIPNGINTDVYKPIDQRIAREVLNLSEDKKLVLFGSVKATSNPRKGFHLLQSALHEISKAGWQDNLELVIFGASQPPEPPDFGFKVHYLGTLNDDLSLALAYSAADVFVLPSTQENLANTIMESLSCGTPCVAFNIGGMPDLINHQENGYLAQPYEIEDLAKGIVWVLENESRYIKLSQGARGKVEQSFTSRLQASRYSQLFSDILMGRRDKVHS